MESHKDKHVGNDCFEGLLSHPHIIMGTPSALYPPQLGQQWGPSSLLLLPWLGHWSQPACVVTSFLPCVVWLTHLCDMASSVLPLQTGLCQCAYLLCDQEPWGEAEVEEVSFPHRLEGDWGDRLLGCVTWEDVNNHALSY